MNPISQLLNKPLTSNQVPEANKTLASQPKSTGNLIQDFINFAKNYKGDPVKDLENMLKSGEVTQAEVDKARDKAQAIFQIVKPFIKG